MSAAARPQIVPHPKRISADDELSLFIADLMAEYAAGLPKWRRRAELKRLTLAAIHTYFDAKMAGK